MPQTLAPAPAEAPARAPGSDFAPLSRQVRDSGLLDRRRGYYSAIIALNLLATAGIWVGVALADGAWWAVALALPAAMISARTGFLGHDAGHRQIARSARANRWLGLLFGNVISGMSSAWWTDKHNRHHANPNHVDKDPDVASGVLVWTAEQAADRRRLAAWMTRHQAGLFFPLLTLEGWWLKVAGLLDLRSRSWRERLLEGGLMAVHLVGYFALAFTLMPTAQAITFVLVHQALFGLHLGSVFAPNHKGMAMPGPDERWDHLRRQVLTSRNIRRGVVTDWMMGGLNYQIEHHLFPSIPRCNLSRLQPLVREHCAKVGLPYAETSALESYAQALGHMHEVGESLRAA
ncbi:fatty acid desaturase family protein [Thermomonospora umbrina]|uniref:Fatty acid desaturase n=1 Tax=Thermomonospora umbrina TaxID=111806 RepID=A0A3D9SHJ7_9ACTN|nr:acyl-CoA desaturase [Thermomonospora umbrina]REE95379.1 fatty acid desaturase [Thermomonospora umbrina]